MITSQWPDILDPHPYKIAPNTNNTKSAVVKGLNLRIIVLQNPLKITYVGYV